MFRIHCHRHDRQTNTNTTRCRKPSIRISATTRKSRTIGRMSARLIASTPHSRCAAGPINDTVLTPCRNICDDSSQRVSRPIRRRAHNGQNSTRTLLSGTNSVWTVSCGTPVCLTHSRSGLPPATSPMMAKYHECPQSSKAWRATGVPKARPNARWPTNHCWRTSSNTFLCRKITAKLPWLPRFVSPVLVWAV